MKRLFIPLLLSLASHVNGQNSTLENYISDSIQK